MSSHPSTEKEIEKQGAPPTVMFPLMALFRKLPSGHAMRAVGPEPAPKTCLQDTPEQRAWWGSSVEASATQLDAQRGEDILATTEQNPMVGVLKDASRSLSNPLNVKLPEGMTLAGSGGSDRMRAEAYR